MKINAAVTVLTAAALLAGCQGSTDPSPPPTSQDALTTTDDVAPTTGDAVPTTQPPDDVQETSSAPGDAVETTEAGGPPPMPDEAKEDSEAGAEAFALHYVDLINYTSKYPEAGLLEPLAADGCMSCENRAHSVEYSAEHDERMLLDLFRVGDSVSLHTPGDSTALVRVAVSQVGQDVVNRDGHVVDTVEDQEATLVFDLSWDQGWSISEVQVDMGRQ